MLKLTIDRVDNGYILSYESEIEDKKSMQYIVIEEIEESEAKTTQKLLFEIVDYLGLQGSKHDPERISIKVIEQNMEDLGA